MCAIVCPDSFCAALTLPLCALLCFHHRYGLLGLLHVIRMTEPDLTMLALGTDLTGLGLNLNAPDSLYKVRVGGTLTLRNASASPSLTHVLAR